MEKQEMINRLARIETETAEIRKKLEGPQDVEPRKGEWDVCAPGFISQYDGSPTVKSFVALWHRYATLAQAEWQAKAEEVRRRAQQIAAAAWADKLEVAHNGGWELCFGGFPVGITFPSDTTSEDCVRQLGPDIAYLHWANSPEFKDSQK